MGAKQKAADLQRRRPRAGRLLQKGIHQSEVALRVGVSPEAVRKWWLKLEAEGPAALKNGRRGRPAGLGDSQRGALAKALKAGVVSQGFPTQLWTLPRVGALIQKLFDLKYSDSQVSRILAAMAFSCQPPTRRALQQDPKAVATWKAKRWPALKKTLPATDAPSFS